MSYKLSISVYTNYLLLKIIQRKLALDSKKHWLIINVQCSQLATVSRYSQEGNFSTNFFSRSLQLHKGNTVFKSSTVNKIHDNKPISSHGSMILKLVSYMAINRFSDAHHKQHKVYQNLTQSVTNTTTEPYFS